MHDNELSLLDRKNPLGVIDEIFRYVITNVSKSWKESLLTPEVTVKDAKRVAYIKI